ncbi:MAG: hypothetical protein NT154_30490, partial [Verrucomicrobia bacterium]|nr:hypothetical protein [Verrucomicrobiota bacterium]
MAILTGLLYGCALRALQGAESIPVPNSGRGVFFVATIGNDAWSGHLPAPDSQGTDGPVATLARALKVVRESRQQGAVATGQPATIYIGGGAYFV